MSNVSSETVTALSAWLAERAKEKPVAPPKPTPPKYLYNFSYDLHEGDDYAGLIKHLDSLDSLHILESTWLIASDKTAAELWNQFSKYFKKGEFGAIMAVKSPYWGWLPKKHWPWIVARIK